MKSEVICQTIVKGGNGIYVKLNCESTQNPWKSYQPTALLITASGVIVKGYGFGAVGYRVGEVCFNTAMTGYQEIMTDPSYTGQIVAFTFPHIGNVGVNEEDIESSNVNGAPCGAQGIVVRNKITKPSNWRSISHLDVWMKKLGIVGMYGVDTRALTVKARKSGVFNAVIVHAPDGVFDIDHLRAIAKTWPGLTGLDLAKHTTSIKKYLWKRPSHQFICKNGLTAATSVMTEGVCFNRNSNEKTHKIIVLDFGVKNNILHLLTSFGCTVHVVPATTTADEILSMSPSGVLLSNGPGDPAATAEYAVPVIRRLIQTGIPVFGICLGHQLLGLACGAKTVKMSQGHHGANHPVKDLTTGAVQIVSMNHGFTIDRHSLPKILKETHISLFDGSNCGIQVRGKPIFSVQYHPEASPGPYDSVHLFALFIRYVTKAH